MRIALAIFVFSILGFAANAEQKAFAYQQQVIADNLSFPWALEFLPNNQILLTERSGRLKRIEPGKPPVIISGSPNDIYVAGQGGLMDVKLHPEYRQNGWIYLTYASGNATANATRLIRGRIKDNKWQDSQVLYTVSPNKDTPVHYGARIVFLPDNTLLLTSGDGFDYREDAQRLNNQLGKILRLNDDGSIPANNPFVGKTDDPLARAVFSLGHRNPQGIVYDAKREVIIEHEHGPAGGDEINLIQPGNNYGWPVITNGKDYSGAVITPFKTYPGMQQPFIDWTPSIAPSGMALYRGDMFKEMNNDLLISTLKNREVRWVQFSGSRVTGQQGLFKSLNRRIRDIDVHPDGSLYIIIDGNPGSIMRIYRNAK